MARGSVCVRPGMLPATIRVPPNSPNPRANPSNIDAINPFLHNGMVIVQNACQREAPKLRATSSILGSISARATSIARTIRGSAIKPAARAAATQVNMISIPKV